MSEYRFDVHVTIEEAVKILNRESKTKGRTFFICVNQSAKIEGDESYSFPVSGNIVVSKAAAIKFIREAYRNFEKRGARVRVCALNHCVFVG